MERMDTENEASSHAKSPAATMDSTVVSGHSPCPTKTAKWLRIKNIYEKLHRPNMYDIGGTYIENVPDFWFTFKTEKNLGVYLLHLFAGNHSEGGYCVGIGSVDSLVYNDKDDVARVEGDVEVYKLDCKSHQQSYITTMSFTKADVKDVLKNRELYISVQLTVKERKNDNNMNDAIDNVKMLHDNVELLMEPVGADFTIVSGDGQEFAVHRSVLSVHSDVFKAMLQDDMAESQTGCVKIVDVNSADLKIMLEYIYTSTIKVIDNIDFSTIIMLADRYNLLGLRKLCDHILIDQLALDTALDILILADQFHCTHVKNKALLFLKRNKHHYKNRNLEKGFNMALLKDLCAVFLS